MVNIFLSGHDGAMGTVVTQCAANQEDLKVTPFPVGQTGGMPCDVVLDFSHPDNLDMVLEFALKRKIPLVIATTGYSKKQEAEILAASREIPICKSGNFSLAVFKFIKAVGEFARNWYGDIEIIETHHNKKADAPSGTALMLANTILDVRKGMGKLVLGRTPESGKRMPGDIGVTAIRGGTVAGLHEVRFFADSAEVIMSEREYGKGSFAEGALAACKFMTKIKAPRIYTMEDLIK
jgi:4-hydroxy-tetrahydrodipicolinate reductase